MVTVSPKMMINVQYFSVFNRYIVSESYLRWLSIYLNMYTRRQKLLLLSALFFCVYSITIGQVLKYLLLQTSGDIWQNFCCLWNIKCYFTPVSLSVTKPLRATNALYLTYFWIDNFYLHLIEKVPERRFMSI